MAKTTVTPLTKEEMEKLIEASKENDFAYMLFMTAKTTGRQLGELLQIKIKDIDLKRKVVIIGILDPEKIVYSDSILNDEVIKLIKDYVKDNKLRPEDKLFGKYSERHLKNMPKVYAQKAGITKNVQFHNFRHYFITELFANGCSPQQIAEILGFSSVGSLMNYDVRIAKKNMKEVIKNI